MDRVSDDMEASNRKWDWMKWSLMPFVILLGPFIAIVFFCYFAVLAAVFVFYLLPSAMLKDWYKQRLENRKLVFENRLLELRDLNIRPVSGQRSFILEL
jgi:hypothetical protein